MIVDEVRTAWLALAPYFEIAHPDRNDPDVRVEDIEAQLGRSARLPADVAAFHALVDRTVITQQLGRWDFELFGRRAYAEPDPEPTDEERRALVEHGVWHIVGRYNDKHELWVCVDPDRSEYGRVYDFNDGAPTLTGRLVPDRVYESWLAFLIAITPR